MIGREVRRKGFSNRANLETTRSSRRFGGSGSKDEDLGPRLAIGEATPGLIGAPARVVLPAATGLLWSCGTRAEDLNHLSIWRGAS